MIEIVIPINVQRIVTQKYTSLYKQMRLKLGRAYPRTKLIANISNALALNGDYIEPIKIKEPIYNQWKNNGYKVIAYNHWFYAIRLKRDANGDTIAVACDALYEADYHNDIMQTTPYESKINNGRLITESQLRSIIRESIQKILNQS